jgi:enoyl-CoA hydratase
MDDGKANALGEAMIEALVAALDRAESEATAMVLAGRPERFSAGFDLRIMTQGPEAARALLRKGSALLLRLYGTPLPLVIACTGHALAGGALMVLTGDERIGTQGDYKLGLNEVAIGMPVPVLAMELARDRLLSTELPRATLRATIYSPEDAIRVGYLDRAEPAGTVIDRAREAAHTLGTLSRTAYSATKDRLRGRTIQLIRDTLESDLQSLLAPLG